MSIPDEHSQLFREEAFELLGELESSLLEIEKTPEDQGLIGKIFRAMHTIKGSSAMFGFDDIAGFTHDIETVFDLVRDGQVKITRELIDLSLSACDQIHRMLAEDSDNSTVDQDKCHDLIIRFRGFIPREGQESDEIKQEETEPEESHPEVTWRIRFRPDREIFMSGTNPVFLLDELREMGQCQVTAFCDKIPLIEKYEDDLCYTYWDIVLTTDQGEDAIRDVFIFVEDSSHIEITAIDQGENLLDDDQDDYKRLGEILTEKKDVEPTAVISTLSQQKPIGQMLVESGIATEDQVQAALSEQNAVRSVRSRRKSLDATTSIRVPSDKLDKLVNLVGELVIAQARLSQISSGNGNSELTSIAEEVERLSVELRDNTLNIRMLPIGTTFGKFRRLVRDLAGELGREVELKTEGAETELDKTVIERLNDPLVHLIRNCIDHGIEDPSTRKSMGKPEKGTVLLSAMHSGAEVHIRIQDDGAGLDRDRILEKGLRLGLVNPGEELSRKEIFSLILQPGFSTNEQVTSISGRGVGMDVVKRCIESLRGSIDIDSTPGTGTVITLKLPLTLAIIEGLLVSIDERYFVLPLSSVKECVELTRQDIRNAHGRNIANVRGDLVPYIRLRDSFNMNAGSLEIEQVVVTVQDDRLVGIVVDNVVGQHQTVIKSLGRIYRDVRGVSGATILGDGTVALILDIYQLVSDAQIEERSLHTALT